MGNFPLIGTLAVHFLTCYTVPLELYSIIVLRVPNHSQCQKSWFQHEPRCWHGSEPQANRIDTKRISLRILLYEATENLHETPDTCELYWIIIMVHNYLQISPLICCFKSISISGLQVGSPSHQLLLKEGIAWSIRVFMAILRYVGVSIVMVLTPSSLDGFC